MGAIECPVNGKFVSLILCTCSDPFSCSKLNLCHQFLWTCTVLNTKRVENAVFQFLAIFSVMVHAIETACIFYSLRVEHCILYSMYIHVHIFTDFARDLIYISMTILFIVFSQFHVMYMYVHMLCMHFRHVCVIYIFFSSIRMCWVRTCSWWAPLGPCAGT